MSEMAYCRMIAYARDAKALEWLNEILTGDDLPVYETLGGYGPNKVGIREWGQGTYMAEFNGDVKNGCLIDMVTMPMEDGTSLAEKTAGMGIAFEAHSHETAYGHMEHVCCANGEAIIVESMDYPIEYLDDSMSWEDVQQAICRMTLQGLIANELLERGIRE